MKKVEKKLNLVKLYLRDGVELSTLGFWKSAFHKEI